MNPIHEEYNLESESCAMDDKEINKDECNDDHEEEEEEEEEVEDTKRQFPDTQIKFDLSGPK